MAKSSFLKKKDKSESQADAAPIICPMCGADVPEGANECPKCEEPFTPEAFESISKEEKGSKTLFLVGVILVLIGGPGVALGSWLHDLLRINIGSYDNFDSFGWVNELVSIVGIIILVVGIILLILSLPKVSKTEDGESGESEDEGDQGG